MTENTKSKTGFRFQIFVLTAGIAMVGSNSLVMSPILGDIANDLGSTPTHIARTMASYGGATAISAIFLARQIDLIGARTMLVYGMLAMIAATIASAFADHWVFLALAQALAGLGAGIILPSTYALATIIAPKGAASRTLGYILTGWSVSMVAGIPLAAFVSDMFGWRAVFFLLAAIAAITTIGYARLPKSAKQEQAEPLRPLLAPLRVAAVPRLLVICLAFMTSFYGVYAFLGDHVRGVLDISAAQASVIVLTYGIGFGVASFGDGLVDRLGPSRVLPWSLISIAAAYALIGPATNSYPLILALAALWGFVNHFGINIFVLLLSDANPKMRGAILGMNSAVSYLGALIGATVFGEIYARFGFWPLPLIAVALLVAAAILALQFLPKKVKSSRQDI